jgi:hypothetical protein
MIFLNGRKTWQDGATKKQYSQEPSLKTTNREKDLNAENMRNIESNLQIACVRWFRLQYPRKANLLNSVPNGGARNAITGAIIKKEGAVRGVADLELNMAAHGYHGLKIEMKTAKGRQSPFQKQWQKDIEAQGYLYAIVRSVDEFIQLITWYIAD